MAISETIQSSDELNSGMQSGESKSWNWHPDIPIKVSPLFSFPPKPLAVLKWYRSAWLPFTELTCYLLLAIVVWNWVQPPLEQTAGFSYGWVGALWLRNFVLMVLVATSLHLWLYRWKKQNGNYRYMRNLPTAKKDTFFGGDQLKDNVFWTLASGVTIWSLYEAGLWVAYANGYAPTVRFADHPIWFVLWFIGIGIWFSFHFYWVHRFLHWKPMYDNFHSVHHRNVVTGPWSGFSMHPVEHLFYLSSLLIHFIIPSHPIHMLFHAYWLTLATSTSHSGYESLVLGRDKKVVISTFFHQLHHRYFNCNYGNVELPLDRWFGSFNDGTTAETRRLIRRNR